jgi:arylsulfatase A-like enzyme
VIFSSDNGAANKNDVEFFQGTLDFRAAKGAVYEGGIRVPAIARWPGKVPAGKVSDFAWAFWDFLPTATELAGVRVPAGSDGISIVPALRGGKQAPHEYLYWEAYGKGAGFRQAIRMGDWKGVREGLAGKPELYDLTRDHREERNVAAEHPDIVARLTAKLGTARSDHPEYPVDSKPVRPGEGERRT